MPEKRKTATSTEVKQRHIKKHYVRYQLSLHKERNAEIISQIEQMKEQGLSANEAIKQLLTK